VVDVTGISVNGATLLGSIVGVRAASADLSGGSELVAQAAAVTPIAVGMAGGSTLTPFLGKLHSVGAALGGNSGVAAGGVRLRGLSTSLEGEATTETTLSATFGARADLAGDGSLSAPLAGTWLLSLPQPLQGNSALAAYLGSPAKVYAFMVGNSSLSAPITTQISAHGVSLGDAVAMVADRMTLAAGGTASGTSSIAGTIWVDLLVGGHLYGTGTAVIENQLAVGGLIFGSSMLTGDVSMFILASGQVVGHSSAILSVPGIVHGTSNVSAHMVVDDLTPICSLIPEGFRYGQLLQRGDLAIWFDGNVEPYEVTYTLCMQHHGGWVCVGPGNQIPVRDGNGEFHVAGFAGWESQPGNWRITWKYRKSSCSPAFEKMMPFRVCDATLCSDLSDGLPRTRKYGWL